MTPREIYKSVHIEITTYKSNIYQSTDMNGQIYPKPYFNRFICDLCLNSKPERETVQNRKTKTCPICQRNITANKITNDIAENKEFKVKKSNSKEVQTQSDTNPNFDLLDEVLKAFKSKKEIDVKTKLSKDVETSTDDLNGKAKLTCSKVFLYSIGDNKTDYKVCTVVNSYPSEGKKSIELIKHKSSSIPQMKMDELKHALREKTKSKDAIEEVNRMFATVRKYDLENSNDNNRPMIRHGPRVLPVVKTKPIVECKYCQVNCMSSGDSANECYHRKNENKCEKCVYMLCCHYKNNTKLMQNDVVLCENCREKHSCEKCIDYNNWEEAN
ncbi:uncharacterized protein LOC115440298 [Manduca sexta]|uniref:uncharacterized protein LOC115440298 n=1 Tax=Manduca sexta TaxID=7130 RepID=UPI0018905CC7|nr:uncharacterized protein LOC115440298 [Manduca sexta]